MGEGKREIGVRVVVIFDSFEVGEVKGDREDSND